MVEFKAVKTVEEIETLAQVASEIWYEYWGAIISQSQIEYMISNFQSVNAVKKQIEEGYEYYFIVHNSEIAGYTGICPKKEHLFLSKLYMKKEFRNCGLGRKTLGFALSRAKFFDLPKINLTVNKYNASTIAAYKKWGFVAVDSVVTDIGEGFVMDDYIMELVWM